MPSDQEKVKNLMHRRYKLLSIIQDNLYLIERTRKDNDQHQQELEEVEKELTRAKYEQDRAEHKALQ